LSFDAKLLKPNRGQVAERLNAAVATSPIRTDRFSRVLFALGASLLRSHTLICNL
jgi:hypothetical protein